MSNINKVFLIGEVTKKPEIKEFKNGSLMVNIRLLTKEKLKNINIFNWHRVIFFNNLAKLVKKIINKGDMIFVQGKINNRKWIDENQNTKYISEIISNEIKLLKKNNKDYIKNEIGDLEEFNLNEQEIENEDNYEEKNLEENTSKDIIEEIEDFNKNEEYFEEGSEIESSYETDLE